MGRRSFLGFSPREVLAPENQPVAVLIERLRHAAPKDALRRSERSKKADAHVARSSTQLSRTPRNTSRLEVETGEEVPGALPLGVHSVVVRACLRGPLQKKLCGEPGLH